MKFKNTIQVCSHDKFNYLTIIMGQKLPQDCGEYENGKCHINGKKCKVVKYVRERE